MFVNRGYVCTVAAAMGLAVLTGCQTDSYRKVETRAAVQETVGKTIEISPGTVPMVTAPSSPIGPGVKQQETEAVKPSGSVELSETEKPSEAVKPSETVKRPAEPVSVALDQAWKYADRSKIHSGAAVLHRSSAAVRKEKTVCVNAGHGTKGGSKVKTLCHPDGSAKVTGGTTGSGAVEAAAVSGGMTFADGTPEAEVTLALAKKLKEVLLERGYDVLMIRESADVQLDNVARTVIANQKADCHVALHWDSTENNKGAFYMSVPNVASYRSMEPVASHWQQHHALGESLIAGLRGREVKIFKDGAMAMDLTQTSYSTVPSVDIELGDKVSDHSEKMLKKLALGLADGLDQFFDGR